jgi:hypothetical protein
MSGPLTPQNNISPKLLTGQNQNRGLVVRLPINDLPDEGGICSTEPAQ